MGSVKEEVKIVGTLKTRNITALFDTGATRNYIRKQLLNGDTVDAIGFDTFEGEREVRLADASITRGEAIRFKELVINGQSEKEPRFIMMENLLCEVIIGVDSMQRLRISPDPLSETISVRK